MSLDLYVSSTSRSVADLSSPFVRFAVSQTRSSLLSSLRSPSLSSARSILTLFSSSALSAESVLSIYTAPILPYAEKFNLTLIAHNSSVLYTPEGVSAGTIKVSTSGNSLPLDVAPQTPFGKGKAWEVFGWAARRAFASGEGEEMVLAPSAMTGEFLRFET